jgi:hypothetical protein
MYGYGVIVQGLDDEVGNDTTIVGVHVWAIGIKDACRLDAQGMLAPVIVD